MLGGLGKPGVAQRIANAVGVEHGAHVPLGERRHPHRDDAGAYGGQQGPRFGRRQDDGRAGRRLFEQLEKGIGGLIRPFLRDHPFGVSDDQGAAPGERGR